MVIYQLKVEIKPYKPGEFIDSMNSILKKVRKTKGCQDFRVYRDTGKENTYAVVGEWKSREAMEKHFKTHEFEFLIGATRVLGETFVMHIGEVLNSGGVELAKKQIADE